MEHSIYLTGIKKALKARQISYSELAKHLKMTESGVKKMLNAKDLSFRRVLQICEHLDVLPGQLFSLSETSSIPEISLSDEQQEALIRNRHLLSVYWRFAIERRSLNEIEKLQKMAPSEMKKHLQRLADLKLIKMIRGQFHVVHQGKFRWSDESKLAKFLNQEWSELTLRRALRNPQKSMHRLTALRLSPESYRELIQKISRTFDEAVQTSAREELSFRRDELQSITALAALVPVGVLDPDL